MKCLKLVAALFLFILILRPSIASATSLDGYRGFIFDGSNFSPITGSNAPANGFFPSAINAQGQVLGSDINANLGFLYSNGTFQQIIPPNIGNSYVRLTGINDSGVIVGYTSRGGFIDNGGTFTAVLVPGQELAEDDLWGINNSGDIVGNYINTQGITNGFLYKNGVYTTISASPFGTTLRAINDQDQILGSYGDGFGVQHNFVDTNGVISELNNPCATGPANVHGINNSDQIVGNCLNGASFLYNLTTGQNTTISYPGFQLVATGISNTGQVAILASPIPSPLPEPPSFLLIGLGLAGAAVGTLLRAAGLLGLT